MIRDDMKCGQHITWDREKSLNLSGVQIKGDIAVSAGDFDHIRNQAGCDGNSRQILLVGSGVCEIWNNCGDSPGRIQPQRLQHDQQFHQVAVHWWSAGLDYIYILAAHAFFQPHEQILVWKLDHIAAAQGLS